MKPYRMLASTLASAVLVGIVSCASSSPAASEATMSAQVSPAMPSELDAGEGRRRHRSRIDFAAAAAELDTTESELKAALGLPENFPQRPRPNLTEAAAQLGITETELQDALGITFDPETGRPVRESQDERGSERSHQRPDLSAAASTLGITEDELKAALGIPERQHLRRPQLDLAGAAQQLGVTEAQVIEALGIPAPPAGERPAPQPQ